jgi:hypothetical protein
VRTARALGRASVTAVVLSVAIGLGCSHTVEGTGPADPNRPAVDGGAGNNSGCAATGSIAGIWQVREPRNPDRSACQTDQCDISQAACSVTLSCSLNTYTGTLSGSTLTWEGEDGANCTATIGVGGKGAEGSCVPTLGAACFFLAQKVF